MENIQPTGITLPKDVIRNLIASEKFQNTGDILGCLKGMFKQVLQEVLEVEMDELVGHEKYERVGESERTNYRNGYNRKTVKSQLGEVEMSVPRDRKGEFDPKILPKFKRNATGLEEKVLGLYAAGMTTRDIADQIRELYDVEISAEFVSKVTDRLLPEMHEWQNRPLDAVYPFVFLDAIHYKIRDNHTIVCKAAYVVLGVDMEGNKDILGIWVGENESAKFWMGVLGDLKTRGVKDIYLCCVDGLTGFSDAIGAMYPKAQVQRCIVHQIRSSCRFVSYKHIKEFTRDLKGIYSAVNAEAALEQFLRLKDKWGKQYPSAIRSWEENWDNLVTFYAYPLELRRIIYTTNAIEALHRQFRKVTKTKAVFPHDDSLRKMLFMAGRNIMKKWTMRYRNWDQVLGQLALLFKDRLPA
jgi:transposase-like protein